MNLGFKTKWSNGEPTYFVEKIWSGLVIKKMFNQNDFNKYIDFLEDKKCWDIMQYVENKSKIHTIREDKPDRWKAGNKIHFLINQRTKDRFQFAPVIPVISVQKIEIKTELDNNQDKKLTVLVDNKKLNDTQLISLALNDGFDSLFKFLMYFKNGFTGKIIHWTNLKY